MPLEVKSPSLAVISAVAEAEGCDPVDIEEPLHDVVDPDSLDGLFNSTRGGSSQLPVEVTFPFCGYEVRVRNDGEVRLSELRP